MSLQDGWLDGWHHAPKSPPHDGYYYDDGYPARVTWHTMEGWLSVATTLAHRAPPQLWASPRTRLKVQSIPLVYAGMATYYQRGYPYDPDVVTNHVQVELEGFAGQTHTWPVEWLDWVADEVLVPIMRFYRHHGIAFDPLAGPHMPGEAMGGSAADDAPQRMGWNTWARFNAQGGHRHVPGNGDRWDPGPLDALHIGRRALAVLGGGATPAPQPQHPSGANDVGVPTGTNVVVIQQFLAARGFDPGPIDGDYGPRTRAAVLAWQRKVFNNPGEEQYHDEEWGIQTYARTDWYVRNVENKPQPKRKLITRQGDGMLATLRRVDPDQAHSMNSGELNKNRDQTTYPHLPTDVSLFNWDFPDPDDGGALSALGRVESYSLDFAAPKGSTVYVDAEWPSSDKSYARFAMLVNGRGSEG